MYGSPTSLQSSLFYSATALLCRSMATQTDCKDKRQPSGWFLQHRYCRFIDSGSDSGGRC